MKHEVSYQNKNAKYWKYGENDVENIENTVRLFHESLPGYKPTKLIEIPNSSSFGVKKVYVKDESSRFGLPSFKILGASWAIHKVLTSKFGIPESSSIASVKEIIKKHKLNDNIYLTCATDGNHGRAVSRMALILDIRSRIYVPSNVLEAEYTKIQSEGKVTVVILEGDYDYAVDQAYNFSKRNRNYLFIQDTSFKNYTDIPQSITEGYNTLMSEIDSQVRINDSVDPSLVLCGAGVGSLTQSVVQHYRAAFRNNTKTEVMSVEPESSNTCSKSLITGIPMISDVIRGSPTIMDGLNCPTISTLAFPILKNGLSYASVINDFECHKAIIELNSYGIKAGPCGAATYASFKKYFQNLLVNGNLNKDDIVVLISTESERYYKIPKIAHL